MSGKVSTERTLGKYNLLLLSPVDVMQFALKLGGRGRWYFNGTEHGYVPVTVDPTVYQISILSCFQLGHTFKMKVNVKECCLSSLKIEVLSLNMSICKAKGTTGETAELLRSWEQESKANTVSHCLTWELFFWCEGRSQ